MKKSEWNDEQLEHLLKQMPIVKDNRDPREIYQSISSKVKRKQKKTWIIPSLATAAALLLIVLIGPSFLNHSSLDISQGGSNQESSAEDSSMKMAIDPPKEENGAQMTTITGDESENREMTVTSLEEPTNYVIRDYMDQKLFTFGVPDAMLHTVIPVSVLIADVDNSHIELLPDIIQKVNATLINSGYGFLDFPLSNYSFSEKENGDGTKNIILEFAPDMNMESLASAESMAFWGAISETFRWFDGNYKEIEFHQNGKVGVMIGQSGVEQTTYNLEKAGKRAYFMYTPFEDGRKFLVPNEMTGKSTTFSDALEAMRNNLEIGSFVLQPTIYENVNFKIDESNSDNVIITFTDDTTLEDNDINLMMIEAIMITAKEFGYQTVSFENTKLDQIGSWDLTGVENTVPVAPNPITLN